MLAKPVLYIRFDFWKHCSYLKPTLFQRMLLDVAEVVAVWWRLCSSERDANQTHPESAVRHIHQPERGRKV